MAATTEACVFAALLLHNGNKDITVENVEKILKAANIKFEKFIVSSFVSSLEGVDMQQILDALSSCNFSAGAAAAPAAGGSAPQPPKEAAAKKEAPPKPESESDESIGLDLFG